MVPKEKPTVMETISHELIEESTDELHDLEEGALKQLVYQLSEEQPDLMSYLLTVGERELSSEEQEVLLFLGLNIWNAARKATTLPFIGDQTIHTKQKANEALIDYLEQNADQGFVQAAQAVITGHAQTPLLGYIVHAIAEEDMEEEEPLVNEDNRDLIFLTLKTLVESIAATNETDPV